MEIPLGTLHKGSSWLKNVSWGDKIMSKLYANEVRNDWRSMRTWVHLMGRPGRNKEIMLARMRSLRDRCEIYIKGLI